MATPATVEFSESNGLSGAEAVTNGIANINFGTADSPNIVPASHPIPQGGNSFLKWLRVHVPSLGTSTAISNLKFYKSSGAYVTGEGIGGSVGYAGLGLTLADSVVATYAHGWAFNGSVAITTPYAGNGSSPVGILNSQKYTDAVVAVPTSVPGGENIPIGGGAGGSITIAGGFSNYIYLGLGTTGSTPLGAVNQKVFTLVYTEV